MRFDEKHKHYFLYIAHNLREKLFHALRTIARGTVPPYIIVFTSKKHEPNINIWRERLLEHHYRSMKQYFQSQGGVSAKLEVVDTLLSLQSSQVISTKLVYVENFLYWKMYFVFQFSEKDSGKWKQGQDAYQKQRFGGSL